MPDSGRSPSVALAPDAAFNMKLTDGNFAEFYRGTVAPLRRYLARMLGSKVDAQDLAHDAYARVFPVMNERDLSKPQAYLFQTARRLALNRLRHRAVAATDTTDAAALDAQTSETQGVPQTVMARQELAHLESALTQLPPGCRTVLLMRKVDLLSHEEIARRLGISRSTVEKQCYRAIRLLREGLVKAAKLEGAEPNKAGRAQQRIFNR